MRPSLFAAVVVGTLVATGDAWAAASGARLPVGAFTAARFDKAPVIDGKVADGEWDRALTTAGLMTPFEHLLQESETTMSLGYDAQRFYVLFRCRRGNSEWKLWKHARANDDYSFSEPSVEIWVTPPTGVPETYQNIINTYPAVFDVKNIPSRGYSAQGWKGNWQVGVSEGPEHYVIEAAVPIKDFGFDTVKSGDTWQFLLCRNCLGAKPRSQASWSITQGFAEIPQHPKVTFRDDGPVAQLEGVSTILTGTYAFELGLVAPRAKAAEADVELRFHKGVTPGDDDRVEHKRIAAAAGSRERINLTGDITDWTPADKNGVKRANFTVTVTPVGGEPIFRQSFAYAITGWSPQPPQKPEKAPAVEPLAVSVQYGPETNTVLVKADIFDLPQRDRVASAEARVVDAETRRVLAREPMRPFRESYGGVELRLKDVAIPVDEFRQHAELRAKQREVRNLNAERKKKGEKSEPLPPDPVTPGKKVQVVVQLNDQQGKPLASAAKDLELLRYAAEWMNNKVGVTDKVIPPWTPVKVKGNELDVWNRTLGVDGLGLGQAVRNGAVSQMAAPMRLVAVKDGQEIEIKAGAPKVARRVEAEADLVGAAEAAGLRFAGRTRVEFDGFVLVNMDVAPLNNTPATVEKLFLEIALPAEEATHFCTTAGGWSAVHDVLPDRWSSQATASGMFIGDFVPYIWLTNSDRAFLWFADHDRGWNHDPEKKLPTQEIRRENGKVYLRVHFFEIPTTVDAPRTITWGWQTFPSRPLPPGWRAMVCASRPPTPHTRHSYFWCDADWAVLWPYYCSPFPWSMEKSKAMLAAASRDPRQRPCPGSIAHSIGRYQDYDGNRFPGLAVDWGATPGQIGNSDVTASKGPNDFRLWHYQRWVREAGFRGLYVDENYLALEDNFLTGNAAWRPDGRLQRAYNYIGLRDYFKRLKVMFHENNVPTPNLWQHISSGAAYHAWLGDVFFEGENVEPTDLNYDYIEVLPAGRMRAIGSSACAGGAMTMMCQSLRHRTQWWEKHTHQFVGWVMAHDVLPEQVPLYYSLMEAGHLWADDVRFLPYWKPSPFATRQTDCLVSAHLADGRALVWVVSTSRKDTDVRVAVDWKKLGMDRAKTAATNAETGESVALEEGGFAVAVLNRDFVPVLLVPHSADGANEG